MLEEEEESICEVSVDERQLEHVSEFRYLGFVLNDDLWLVADGRV